MEILKKNQIFEAVIDGWSSAAAGVCHIDGRAVFVPGAISGEKWRVKLLKVSNTAIYGKGIELLTPSPDRVKPRCPYFSACGGCSAWHMTYEAELRFKLGRVNDALHHIAGLDFTADAIIPCSDCTRYRNKGICAVGLAGGKAVSGFYRARSHDIIPIKSCLIQSEFSDRAAAAVTTWLNTNGIKPYDEANGKGTVRHVFSRCAVHTGDAVVCIVSARGFGGLTGGLVEYLRKECPELTGIVLNVNKTRGNSVLAGDFYTLWGSDIMRDSLCGFDFELSPQAFYQINPPQAEKLYEKAVDLAGLTGRETVLDLYCGAGTISLCLSRAAGRVIGAEIVPEAVENAAKNAAANHVDNVEFITGDAGDAAEKLSARGIRPDVVVVDPPRKGMYPQAIKATADMEPGRIVYVSCNPSTLARDIKLFGERGYELTSATAVDMFPRTPHVETVVLMSRVEGK